MARAALSASTARRSRGSPATGSTSGHAEHARAVGGRIFADDVPRARRHAQGAREVPDGAQGRVLRLIDRDRRDARDSWIDIDGGISTLFVFSSKGRREMPNDHVYLDGPPEMLSRNGTFVGQHIYTPKLGAAMHINAFNFPVLGHARETRADAARRRAGDRQAGLETAYLTELMVRQIIDSGISCRRARCSSSAAASATCSTI